jgi:hypothetical protein
MRQSNGTYYEGLDEYALALNYVTFVSNSYDDTLDILGKLQVPFVTALHYAGTTLPSPWTTWIFTARRAFWYRD